MNKLLKENNQTLYEELCKQGKLVELIDNHIYWNNFNSKIHNKLTMRLSAEFDKYFRDKPCEVYSEQIEVILGDNKIKPDIFVVCGENEKINSKGESILTIPKLIIEVVSKSNASLDTITKMDLYSRYLIEEYCLIYQDGSIVQMILEDGIYRANKIYTKDTVYISTTFPNIKIDLSDIFYGL
ncbi:MAG: Uma2 family endonuclease [Sarcina sp.]